MRGKGGRTGSSGRYTGITPACAGKRTRPRRWVRPPRDHPRVCGEKAQLGRFWLSAWGSPLRVRGKAGLSHGCLVLVGITPARAGKSVSRRPRWTHTGDHPRMCGEKSRPFPTRSSRTGSPPRMRGKDALPRPLPQKQGITPACAGKRVCPLHRSPWHRDHPRVCGEKIEMPYELLLKEGSPPRMRGKGNHRRIKADRRRITPAYAGKRHRMLRPPRKA